MCRSQHLPVVSAMLLATVLLPAAGRAEDGWQEEDPPGNARDVMGRRVIPVAEFEGVPFSDAATWCGDVGGINVYVNRRALEACGAKMDTPVTLKARDIPYSVAWARILGQLSTDRPGAAVCFADDELLYVSTEDDMRRWSELRRRARVGGGGGGGGADAGTIEWIDFDEIVLVDALQYLAAGGKVRLRVDWRQMAAAGVEPETPVKIRLRQVKFETAVLAVLREATGGVPELDYTVERGVLTVFPSREGPTSAEKLAELEAATVAKLDRRLKDVEFDGTPLDDVLNQLGKAADIALTVRWDVLAAADVARDTPCTARMRNVRAGKALRIVLEGAGGEWAALEHFVTESGEVVVTTTEDADATDSVEREYDIRDLVTVPAPPGGKGVEVDAELVKNVVDLITDTVSTGSWVANGGRVGVIKEVDGVLIVTQRTGNHRKIRDLLSQLRETRGDEQADGDACGGRKPEAAGGAK